MIIWAISWIVHFIYMLYLSKSYEDWDLSHVYPIVRSAPVLIMIFSIFVLKEDLSMSWIIWITIATFWVYIINLKKLSFKTILEPISFIKNHKSSQYALIAMLWVAIYSVIDKYWVNYIHPLIFIYCLNITKSPLMALYIFRNKNKEILKNEWIINKWLIGINWIIVLLWYLLILYVFSFEKLSYVVWLRQLSIIFAILLWWHLLQEKNKAIRLFAGMLIFVWVFLISIAE